MVGGRIAYGVVGVAIFAHLCLVSWLALQGLGSVDRDDILIAPLMVFLWASWLTVLVVGRRAGFGTLPRWALGLCGSCVAVSAAVGMVVA